MSEQTMGQRPTQGDGLDEGGSLGQTGTQPSETPDVPTPSGSEAQQADQAERAGRTGRDEQTGPAGTAGIDPDRDRMQDPRTDDAHPGQTQTPAERNLSGDGGESRTDDADGDRADERPSPEEFAAEHDPEKHDTAAGEEFRQRGDWTADDTGGPQVWAAEGTLVEGAGPGTAAAHADSTDTGDHQHGDHQHGEHQEHHHDDTAGGRRTSSVEEIRDGGFGVGSAAPLDDGAMPFGHPVKAWHDTQTFVDDDHPRYHDAEPHVWFTDADAARQAGFRRADD